MMRKSIVFDKNTPDVFYCPQHKPTGFEKMIVNAKPLSRLCQFEGKPIPPDYKSDCYNDVDETEYACKEKYRIMVSHRRGHGFEISPPKVHIREDTGRARREKRREVWSGSTSWNRSDEIFVLLYSFCLIKLFKRELVRFSCNSRFLRSSD